MTDPSAYTHTSQPQTNHTDTVSLLSCDPAGLRLIIPPQAEFIIEKLEENGFEAYVVGGCVRDILLGREPGDWDITTKAAPWQVKAIFGRTIDTGIAHGTVTVMRGKEAYEVTTYRIDGEYEDGRHPKNVAFTPHLKEDLRRRDFTINAMAYSHSAGLIDIFDGRKDLAERRIRCVGNPLDRFGEDALRILRALRFSAQLNFGIEEETREALKTLAPNLSRVSKERIHTELTKLLVSPCPNYINTVFSYGIAPWLSETFGKIQHGEAKITARVPPSISLRWAAFLCHETEETARAVMKELKMDNDTIDRVKLLVRWRQRPMGTTESLLRKTMSQMTGEAYSDLLVFKQCVEDVPETQADLDEIVRLTRLIESRGDCIRLKDLAVTGNDLIGRGMKPGRGMGRALGMLLDLVLEDPEKNKKDTLLAELEAAGCLQNPESKI